MKTALMLTFLFLGQTFNIELAITPMEQSRGLMYRTEWSDDSQGMLFINDSPRKVAFWMKNTYLNMGIFYLDKNFNILEVNYPMPLDETSIISESDKVQYILELNPEYTQETIREWSQFRSVLRTELNKKQREIQKIQN